MDNVDKLRAALGWPWRTVRGGEAMTHAFNDLEGLRIAVEMEKRGAQLYQRALRICQAPGPRLCSGNWRRTSGAIKGNSSGCISCSRRAGRYGPTTAWNSRRTYRPWRRMWCSPVGWWRWGMDNGFDSPAAILRYAIQAENDSLLFYGALMEQTGDPGVPVGICRDHPAGARPLGRR